MSTRKKRFILGLTGGVMALGLVGVIASQNTFNIGIGVHAEDPNNILWKHYAAVEASPIMHGSKEFWANCSELGTHSLTEPTTGRIEDGGDFSTTSYFAELTPKDDRYVGYEETTTYYEGWTKENFTYTNGASLITIVDGFGTMFWREGKEVQAKYIAEFGRTDNDGWMMKFGETETDKGTITFPKTDFSSLLDGGKIARSEIGGYNTYNDIYLTSNGVETKINANGSDQTIAGLTKTLLTFYKDSSGKVHVNFIDTIATNPCSGNSIFGELTLTDAEANGTSSLMLSTTQAGNDSRRYWLGKLRFTNCERVYKDFSSKTGITVNSGNLRTQAESVAESETEAPFGQWKAPIHPFGQAIGFLGNKNEPAVLTFDKIDFNKLLNANEGVYFTFGAWNGGEYISFVDQGKDVNLGLNGPGMTGNNDSLHTKQTIEYTWHNWQIAINKTGMHVYNVFENTYKTFILTDKQLSGEESLVFKLARWSAGRFFLLTNMVTYAL